MLLTSVLQSLVSQLRILRVVGTSLAEDPYRFHVNFNDASAKARISANTG